MPSQLGFSRNDENKSIIGKSQKTAIKKSLLNSNKCQQKTPSKVFKKSLDIFASAMKVKVQYVFNDEQFDENYNILATNENHIENGRDTVCLSFTDHTPEKQVQTDSIYSTTTKDKMFNYGVNKSRKISDLSQCNTGVIKNLPRESLSPKKIEQQIRDILNQDIPKEMKSSNKLKAQLIQKKFKHQMNNEQLARSQSLLLKSLPAQKYIQNKFSRNETSKKQSQTQRKSIGQLCQQNSSAALNSYGQANIVTQDSVVRSKLLNTTQSTQLRRSQSARRDNFRGEFQNNLTTLDYKRVPLKKNNKCNSNITACIALKSSSTVKTQDESTEYLNSNLTQGKTRMFKNVIQKQMNEVAAKKGPKLEFLITEDELYTPPLQSSAQSTRNMQIGSPMSSSSSKEFKMTEREAKIKAKIDDLKKIITIQEELDEIIKKKGAAAKKLTHHEQLLLTDKLHKDAEERKSYQEALLKLQIEKERLEIETQKYQKIKV
ncbi:UNKNOWN [Stylonychia lemnae]|uniref:Uncharacterized protein n=1 Tax=Stylonychia lemnae TaxID=5949 RepID=A0A078ANV4_STYLE|nr:UNKNOWN [Stylonychia lemnae]|eukprot:CDW82987.1 UNKNOWN [Stylonychia lemnae]